MSLAFSGRNDASPITTRQIGEVYRIVCHHVVSHLVPNRRELREIHHHDARPRMASHTMSHDLIAATTADTAMSTASTIDQMFGLPGRMPGAEE